MFVYHHPKRKIWLCIYIDKVIHFPHVVWSCIFKVPKEIYYRKTITKKNIYHQNFFTSCTYMVFCNSIIGFWRKKNGESQGFCVFFRIWILALSFFFCRYKLVWHVAKTHFSILWNIVVIFYNQKWSLKLLAGS